MSKNRNMIINMIASIVALGINLIISFLFTPYIVARVGSEAYGFVGLANSIINYITIITVALNSTAGRFISIAVYQKETDKANKYFSSVLIANMILAGVVILVSMIGISRLESLIDIPINLEQDVKYLFIFMVTNFILSLIGTVFTVATFIKNKLYLSSIVNTLLAILKLVLLGILFNTLGPCIAFYGIVACICSIIGVFCNVVFTKRLVPELRINLKKVEIKSIIELLQSGIWNSITKISQVLLDGLDLLISNIWISPLAMGQLSIAKIIVTTLGSLLSTITGNLAPELTRYYANGEIHKVVEELKINMKITGFFANIPFCFIVIFGDIFFSLWMPTQDYKMIHLLTILSIQGVMTSGTVTGLNNVFLLTNKLRVNSLVWLGVSLFNIVTVIILLHTTYLGVYVVAGVSTTVGNLVNLTFVPIYTTRCLGIKWYEFYSTILRYIVTNIIILGCLIMIRIVFCKEYSWIVLIILGIVTVVVGGIINLLFLVTKKERNYVLQVCKIGGRK